MDGGGLIVGSVFSGAGLLDVGLHHAGVEHAWFVERDEFRRGLLARRWPGVPVHDDIRTVGAHNLKRVDGVVGGFPCKGNSTAGKRTGLSHPETALWAEFARVVCELEPGYVVVENVANILSIHRGEVWGQVLGDLAALGFDVAWDCIPASAVRAPHGRDRVFAIAAHAERGGQGSGERHVRSRQSDASGVAADVADAARAGLEGAGVRGRPAEHGGSAAADAADVGSERGRPAWRRRPRPEDGGQDAARPDDRRGEAGSEQDQRAPRGQPAPLRHDADRRGVRVEWGDYGPAVQRWEAIHGPAPEPLVSRVDDGDAKLRRLRARVDRSRLSALGDGVHVYVGWLVGDALMALYEADHLERAAWEGAA